VKHGIERGYEYLLVQDGDSEEELAVMLRDLGFLLDGNTWQLASMDHQGVLYVRKQIELEMIG
jgi:hypothetical protein